MVAQTQRFQPYGLMKSACFLKSGNRLSCSTCHNPHRDVETAPEAITRSTAFSTDGSIRWATTLWQSRQSMRR